MGDSTRPETYDVTDRRARYVRIVGRGTTAGSGTGVSEIAVH